MFNFAKASSDKNPRQQALTGVNSHPSATIQKIWEQVKDRVAPVWPLEDYVAVNPFMGLSQYPFIKAQQLLSEKNHQDILLPWSEYQRAYAEGKLSTADLSAILEAAETPTSFSVQTLQYALSTPISGARYIQYYRLSEWMDQTHGTHWEMLIQDEISRYCAAHYDRGFASWGSPWAKLPLYAAWRSQACYDRRLEKLGFTRLNTYLQVLPDSSLVAIEAVLTQMKVQVTDWEDVLYAYLLSMNGWASWIQYQHTRQQATEDLHGLLAMRLIYEWALWQNSPYGDWSAFQAALTEHRNRDEITTLKAQQQLQDEGRYLCQQALEKVYQRRLLNTLSTPPIPSGFEKNPATKSAQFVFCIDVRSERMRRHLEQVHPGIETFGFAGFLGMPMGYRRLGDEPFIKHCPAPLEPAFQLEEHGTGTPDDQERVYTHYLHRRILKKTWKQFKSSAVSCFSFVESFGMSYVPQLIMDTLGFNTLKKPDPNLAPRLETAPAHEDVSTHSMPPTPGPQGLTREYQMTLALRMLKQLGLTRDFAPWVVLCGHGSTVQNTPYQAAYQCGACCGHSGTPNALAAAKILNTPEVRHDLMKEGIQIPENTFFLAGLHDTTRDAIHLLNAQEVPNERLSDLRNWIESARQETLKERARVMQCSVKQLLRRSSDWSEVRPEWGLAGNASFIIGKRSHSYKKDLEGRTFLHRYHHEDDSDGQILESIMTAPMVVTHWINMQYYASSVSPDFYASGDKTLHNVVGNLGVLEGSGGDLRTGLPLQSIHNGDRLQYLPLRLSVVIEAPRERIAHILQKHANLQTLVDHHWLTLFAHENDGFYRYHQQEWKPWQNH